MSDEPLPPDRPPAGKSAAERKQDEANEALAWHRMAGIGVEFIVAVGLFAGLGWFADSKLGTSPWLLIAGCGLGFVGGLWNMMKAARKLMG